MENQKTAPILKSVKPIRFLYFEVTTTLAELHALVGNVVERLYEDAAEQKLFVGGPAYWNYFNFTTVDKPFDLEICLPLAKAPASYNGKFQIKTSKPFQCISYFHDGSWEKLSDSYTLLRDYIEEQKLPRTGESREVYVNINFEDAEANRRIVPEGVIFPARQ